MVDVSKATAGGPQLIFHNHPMTRPTMRWKLADRRVRLNLIGVIVLLGGLGSALLMVRLAENHPNDAWSYEEEGGSFYPVRPGDSKKYLRDLELYGGKVNVLATEFRLWLVGFFQGKALAYTVALIAVFLALVFFYAATHPPSGFSADSRDNDSNG